MKLLTTIEERYTNWGIHDCVYYDKLIKKTGYFIGTKDECLSRIKNVTSKSISYYLLIGYYLDSVDSGKYTVICTLKRGDEDCYDSNDVDFRYTEVKIEFQITI